MEIKDIKIVTEKRKGINNTLVNVEKAVFYDENGIDIYSCETRRDETGHLFYFIPNLKSEDRSFEDRPLDAIESIRSGLGDEFLSSQLFGLSIRLVIRYVDREYGEKMREKTISTWEGTEFLYSIKFCVPKHYMSQLLICKNEKLSSGISSIKDILTFKAEKEALDFSYEINKKSKEYFDVILKNQTINDKNSIEEDIMDAIVNKLNLSVSDLPTSLYYNTIWSLFDDYRFNKYQYKLKIVQMINLHHIPINVYNLLGNNKRYHCVYVE